MVANENREVVTPYGSFTPFDFEVPDKSYELPPNEWEIAAREELIVKIMHANNGGKIEPDPFVVQKQRRIAIAQLNVAETALASETEL